MLCTWFLNKAKPIPPASSESEITSESRQPLKNVFMEIL
jgi:hypothetical protein